MEDKKNVKNGRPPFSFLGISSIFSSIFFPRTVVPGKLPLQFFWSQVRWTKQSMTFDTDPRWDVLTWSRSFDDRPKWVGSPKLGDMRLEELLPAGSAHCFLQTCLCPFPSQSCCNILINSWWSKWASENKNDMSPPRRVQTKLFKLGVINFGAAASQSWWGWRAWRHRGGGIKPGWVGDVFWGAVTQGSSSFSTPWPSK